MENSKTTMGKSSCTISNTKMYLGDNNELICLKIYTGDWGDWDEKPKHSNLNHHNNATKTLKDKNYEGR